MKEIQLSQSWFCKNKGKYVALVDDEDYDSLNQFRWQLYRSGNTFYAARALRVDGKRHTQYMHWDILKEKRIDHIDHDGLNNQKSNLRLSTRSQNSMNVNKRHQEVCTSIYKGVSFFKRYKKWTAQIHINGKRTFLGYFDTEVEAAKAYNQKAIELFCEFACLNNVN